jgi:hypothetical protein
MILEAASSSSPWRDTWEGEKNRGVEGEKRGEDRRQKGKGGQKGEEKGRDKEERISGRIKEDSVIV